ncbi:Cytoskeleton organization protein (Dec1) [Penicillium atrosanguineum]|uniref:60S ribosomal protein L36 n=1 Tax=Penicillium atrosanguineum TaxID=1132637 RepID=A0A9W9Q9A8_9EURO|nr:Cytoskeleton organization protein (Dec1) [Penicillium atrosanguineum]
MASANDPVFLRRNNQVQDAIDGQNLKQALQLVEKRMKKGEDTRFLKAWKAHILFLHADDAHKQRGIAETLELCAAEPPTTDLETLDKLFRTLQRLDGHSATRSSLWEKASKAKPQDLEIQLEWFTTSFESNDWKSAQKAAMSLQKNFPRERKYYFWAILLTHLLATDAASSDMERKLFWNIGADLLSHSRVIQTSEELRLLIKIFESQNQHAEIVKILDSENLGLKSRIIRNDKSFLISKATALASAGLWDEGLAFAKDLYTVSEGMIKKKLRELDDWGIWSLLVEAIRNIKTPGIATETQKFVEEFIKANPKSRNAALAFIDLSIFGMQRGEMTADDVLSACQRYADQHKHKLYLFGDLRRALADNRTALSKIADYLSIAKDDGKDFIVPMINSLKISYCLNISGAEDSSSKNKVEAFVRQCLNLYQSCINKGSPEKTKEEEAASATESQPRDDLCILAAMALLRASETGEIQARVPDSALIRAASVLERLLLDSPHNYQARLLLVRTYLILGAGSLALSTFSKLSVKQIQFESVAHNLFTRLATIHPHSAPPVEGAEYKDFDPQAAFIQALNFYRTSEVSTLKFRTRCIVEGSFVNAEEMVQLRDRLRNSICRKMFALEVRRSQRLAGGDPLARYDDIARNASPSTDNRDYDVFMNCEGLEKPSFEQRMRVGPIPKENWMVSARVTDQLFCVLKGITLQKPLTLELDVHELETLSISEAAGDQTVSEKEAAKIHSSLLKAAVFMAGSKTTTPEQADKALVEVEEFLKLKKKDLTLDSTDVSPIISTTAFYLSDLPTAPTWRFFHVVFTLLETLNALSQLTTLASRKGSKATKLPKERVDRLSTLVAEIFDLVRANTKALKKRVSASGVLSGLVDLVGQGDPTNSYNQELQQTLEATLDGSAVEVFCGSLMESWEDALDGVIGPEWVISPSPNNSPTAHRAKTRNCAVPVTRRICSLDSSFPFYDNHRQPPQSPTVEMAQERSGIVLGTNSGHKTTALNTPKNKISRTKGQSSRRTQFVRDITREVVGLAPYERRIVELLRNAQDKRARKLAKKRLGTFGRGKAKVEDMQRVIAESRRVQGH